MSSDQSTSTPDEIVRHLHAALNHYMPPPPPPSTTTPFEGAWWDYARRAILRAEKWMDSDAS